MKKRILKNSILAIFLICLCVNCSEPSFYEYSWDQDECRVPLIKPYQLYSYNSGKSWFFDLLTHKYTAGNQTHGITSIGIKDSLIILYIDKPELPDFNDTPAWIIVDTESKSEVAFDSEAGYKTALDSLKIDKVNLYDVKKVFEKFNDNYTLPPEWPKEAKK